MAFPVQFFCSIFCFLFPAQGPARVRLPPSAALAEGLSHISDPSVFLPQLADRFLRLVLQLGQRYITWAAGLVAVRRDAATASATAAGGPPTPGERCTNNVIFNFNKRALGLWHEI